MKNELELPVALISETLNNSFGFNIIFIPPAKVSGK